ncbi:MAG: hypothetical protein ACR2QG_11465 [Gammaproteobacteria bacterium]
MRVTDHRYAGEMAKFNLAVRMISHEARTGTIRSCTGFSEDRIRKIYKTYFRDTCEAGTSPVKRRRGKSPKQIAPLLNSTLRQSEATVLTCLFLYCELLQMDDSGALTQRRQLNPLLLGERICEAYETYQSLQPEPGLSFERAWSLYRAIVHEHELVFARCDQCEGPYIQDRYVLQYGHCPFCEIKKTPS